MKLDLLQRIIEKHLGEIEKQLPPAYKLTLVARNTTIGDDKNADIILTMDDLDKVITSINKLRGISK